MKRLKLLYVAAFLMHVALGGQIAGLPLLAKKAFDATLWQLALIGLATMLGHSLFSLATGALVGRAKPITLSIVGAGVLSIVILLAIPAGGAWHLVGVAAACSVGWALFWPMLEAAIAEGASGRALSRRMGRFNVSWSLGDAVGIPLAGALYDVRPWAPFAMMALTAGVIMVIISMAKRMEVAVVGGPGGELIDPEELETSPLINIRFTRAAWVGNFVGAGAVGVVRSIFAAPAVDVFAMSGALYGLVVGTVNLSRTASFWLLTHWRNWHYRLGIYMSMTMLMAAGMAGVALAALFPGPVGIAIVFVSFAAVGFSFGMPYYSSIFYSVHTDALAESKTRLHEAVIGAGGAAGVLASGAAGQLTANTALSAGLVGTLATMSPFLMCSAAVVAGMTVSWGIVSRKPIGTVATSEDSRYLIGRDGHL